MKASLVLLLTLATTVFMYEGWYKPNQLQAVISKPTNWTQQYAAVAYPAGTVGANFNITAGSGRLLVVAIASTSTAIGAQTVSNVTWNGQALTLAAGDAANATQWNHTYLYYLKDASMPATTTAAPLAVTITGGTAYYTTVHAAVYAGVDQTTPFTDAKNHNAGGGAGTTTAGPTVLSVAANDQAIQIVNLARVSASTIARTMTTWDATNPAGWTTAGIEPAPITTNGPCFQLYIRDRNLLTATTDNSTHTISSTAWDSITAMSIKAATAPTLTTPTATSITSTTATMGANITSTGGASITQYGTYWGTAATPTTNPSTLGAGTTGVFTDARSGLTAGTKIYYRGYATNSVGTSYSPDGSFYTEPATAASGANFTAIGLTGMTVNWTRGSGDGVIVLMKSGSAVDAAPADGTYTGYNANSVFGTGTLIGGANRVIYKGTGTSVAVTNLTQSTTYYVAVYEYSGTADTAGVNQGTAYDATVATGNQATASPCAAGTPTSLTVGTETVSSVPLTWTAGASTDYFRVYRGGVQISTDGAVTTGSFPDSTASPGATYSYTVSGYNTAGSCQSAQSTAVNAYTLPVAPAAPTVSNFGDGTALNVALNADTNTAATTTYAIRINGGAFTNQFVQAGGAVAAGQVWQSMAAWGTKKVTGLTNGTTYTFDIVARNSNPTPDVSAYSPTAAKAPSVTLSSSITSCGGCHGYPGTSNPFVDVGRTNNAAQGRFSGSHVRHTGTGTRQYNYACSVCHVAPATQTSADNGHSRGSIQMANPINVNTGAKYGKGTSWAVTNTPTAFQTCSATYCHSNGTSVATGVIYTNISSPRWGKSNTGCTICHGTGGTTGAPNYSKLMNMTSAQSGGTNWTTPSNALRADGAFATYANASQNTLIFTNFGYTTAQVADSDTVTGITVIVRGWAAGTGANAQLNVQLTLSGAGVGTAKVISLPGTTSAQNGDVYATTTTTDLWGAAWTPTQIRNTTFGVILKDNVSTTSQFNIDAVRVIVHTNRAPKMNSHSSARGHRVVTCDTCHNSVTYSAGVYTPNVTLHTNGSYNVQASLGYTFAANGGACGTPGNGCHGPTAGQWGGTLGCVDCHNKVITRTKGRPGATLANVVAEFGLAWGHKKAGRNKVTDDDCCVCHLEGDGVTYKASAYHQDGNIDLRNPQGAGETPITNISGGAFTFQRYSISFAAGTRTSTGHTSDTDIANVITQKFCLVCHSANGATNPTARSNNGGTGTQYMPFGGINLGANYTVVNGAAAAGGLVNVNNEFATTNTSVHPVRGPRNSDYPVNTRLAAPYNNIGTTRVAGSHNLANSVVMNCFDCHNLSGTPLTLRTIVAHGNAATIRGTYYVTNPTFCSTCHTGYSVGSSNDHGLGSAGRTSAGGQGGMEMESICAECHGSQQAYPTRPLAAQDFHGNTWLVGGAAWGTKPSPNTAGKVYGFIRNTANWLGHSPYSVGGVTGTPTCQGDSSHCAGNRGTQPNYSPGGSY